MGVIYRLVSPKGKSYVGQTTMLLRKRLAQHRCPTSSNHCRLISKAIKKYKWCNMKVEVLVEVPDDLLDEYECKFMDAFNTLVPHGYNLVTGGSWMNTEEGKAMMRHTTTDNWKDPVIRKKRVDGLQLAFSDPATAKRRSDAAAAAIRQPESRAKSSKTHKPVCGTPEMRAKYAVAHQAKWDSRADAERDAFSTAMLDVHKRPGMKEKHRQACIDAKKRLTPEQRKQAALKCWEKRRQGTYQHGGVIRKKTASKATKLSGINPRFLKKKL